MSASPKKFPPSVAFHSPPESGGSEPAGTAQAAVESTLVNGAQSAVPPAGVQHELHLIEEINNGHKELFYDLVQPYERSIYLSALSVLGNEADAEEIAQEAVLKAFMHLKQFRGESKFSTWVIRITINEARMRLRRQRRVDFEPILEEREDGDYVPRQIKDWREIPSQSLERREVRQALKQALAALPAIYREVFILRDVQQLSIAETAEILGITGTNVKARLLRARLRMRDQLAPGLGGPWDMNKAK